MSEVPDAMLARNAIGTSPRICWLVFLSPQFACPDEYCELIVHHSRDRAFQDCRELILIKKDHDEEMRALAHDAFVYLQERLAGEHATAPPSLFKRAKRMQQLATELSRAIGKTGGPKPSQFKNPPSELDLLTALVNAIKLRDEARPLTDRRLSSGSQAVKDRNRRRKAECIASARNIWAKEPTLRGNKLQTAARIIAIAKKTPDSTLRTDRHGFLGIDTIRRYLKEAMDAGELPTNGKRGAH